MQNVLIRNKVNIFISSNCNQIFNVIRESLKIMLLETGMCEVYVFEETNATSYDVVQSYMSQLEKCDLVIFLVDNSEPLGEGTIKEVKRAKELQKKCMYLFCDELERKPTELQKELKANYFEKYQIVSKLSKMAEEAYKSVINDITDIYSLYCSGKFAMKDSVTLLDELHEENDKELIIENGKAALKREVYSGYEYTKSILNNNVIFNVELPQNIKTFDYVCGDMMHVIIGNKKIVDIDYESLKKNILELHSGQLKKAIEYRLDAIFKYYIGNLEDAKESINKALIISKKIKNIPTWVTNDIAIDYRNIDIIIGNEENEFRYGTEGQKILNESDELVYHPLLDRFAASYYESAVKQFLKEELTSPFTINIGGFSQIIDKIVDIFVAAITYGSLTHILRIRNKLCDFLQGVCIQNPNHKMYLFIIKLLLLCGEKNELKKFIKAYGEYTDTLNDDDCALENAVSKIGIASQRVITKISILEFFGNYLNDEHFQMYYEEISNEVEKWFNNPYSSDSVAKGYLDVMLENQYRIGQNNILKNSYKFFDKNCKRWYDNVFEMISKLILKDLTEDEIGECMNWIKICVKDEDIKQKCHCLPEMIQNIRLYIGKCDELDYLVEESFPQYYKYTYSLNVFEHKNDESWEFILEQIKDIMNKNDTQGKGGVYSRSVVNPYETIFNIISYGKVSLQVRQLKKLIEELMRTLKSEKQTNDAKFDSLNLIALLKIQYPKIKCINEAVKQIIDNKSSYLRATNALLLPGYDEGSLRFACGMIQVINQDDVSAIDVFTKLTNEHISTKINAMYMIVRLIENDFAKCISEKAQYALVQYIFESSMNDDSSLRFHSYVAMIKLREYTSDFSKIILNRISKAMDGEVCSNKIGILSRLKKDNTEIINYIFEKGKADNHYCVREVANRQ